MKASLNSLYHQANDWLRELQFYSQELDIMDKRISEVANKNTGQDILAQVEHFQNSIIAMREEIDILKHKATHRNTEIIKQIELKPEHTSEHFAIKTDAILIGMEDLAHKISDTRYQLNHFLFKVF